jgi:hypothetical protein
MKIKIKITIPEYNFELETDETEASEDKITLLEDYLENLDEAAYLSVVINGNKSYIYPELIRKSIVTVIKTLDKSEQEETQDGK